MSGSEIAAEKAFRGAYGHPLVVDGVLYLPDFDAGRVMGYLQVPTENGAAADFVLGKSDFDDAVDGPSPTAMSGSQTVFTEGENLFVLDYSDSRIVRYNGFPTTSGAAAVLAIGQPSLVTDGADCSATAFDSPEGATIAAGRFIVADTSNERVLIWNQVPTEFGVPADIMLGQQDMTSASHGDGADEFHLPYFLASNGTQIAVADTSNNRVLIWNEFPTENGVPADVVLGQSDFGFSDKDCGAAGPTSTGLEYPTGILFYKNFLFVSDHENKRYLVFEGL